MNITFLVVLLFQLVLGVHSARPWFLRSSALSVPLNNPTYTVIHSTGNSTHFFLLDQGFRIHYFRLVSGSVVYDKTINNADGAGVSDGNWTDTRTSVDVKIGLNPYNNELCMVKCAYIASQVHLSLYRYSSVNAQNGVYGMIWYLSTAFTPDYAHIRVKLAFDSTYFYAAYYNDPNRSTKSGYFIVRMLHSLDINVSKYIESYSERILSIDFNCHKSLIICIWRADQTVIEYSMSTMEHYSTYSLIVAPTALNFNPQIVETSDGSFTYYLHHSTSNSDIAVLQKRQANHNGVNNELAQLPYNLSTLPREAFDMAIANNGQIITAMTTTPSPPVGIGNRDVAVFRYSPTLQLESQFLLSTAQQDNISRVFVPDDDPNSVIICGTTDGSIDSPTSTSIPRRAFIARFVYFSITGVTTTNPNVVLSGESINITFSALPPSANTGTPIVTFNLQPCASVVWAGSILLATIPGGMGGPYELLVQFNYLPHTPSVSFNGLSYVPATIDVWPQQGPAVGYDITIVGSSFFPEQSVTAFIGGKTCTSLLRLNSTAITCRTPPGTGRNLSVVLSNGGLYNITENFQISYDPPVLTAVAPIEIPTDGTNVTINGINFGPCAASSCPFASMTVTIGGNLCNTGLHFNDSTIQCALPEGYLDGNITISVTVNGQQGVNFLNVSYSKPSVTSINPKNVVSRNPTIFIDGLNFGPIAAPRIVMLHSISNGQNYSCPNITWISHASLRCDFTSVNLPLSEKFNVTVTVGNRTSAISSAAIFGTGVINDPPSALLLGVSTFEEQSTIIQFEVSDPNVDDIVTLYIHSNPTNGNLYQIRSNGERGASIDTVSGPVPVSDLQVRVLYVPFENFNGPDNFTYRARDSWGAESTLQNAAVTVISVPDPPVPKSMTYVLDEDTVAFISLDIIDPDTPLSERIAIVLSLPQQGSLLAFTNNTWEEVINVPHMLYLNTSIKYSPNKNYFGTDSFIYMANDGSLNSTVNATITLTIKSVNDPPSFNATNLKIDIYEDTDTIITFDISDVDIGDKLTVKITDIYLNGSLYIPGLPKEPRNLLGEGSELRGPPYQVLYSPAKDFTSAAEDTQYFNVTYSDTSNDQLLFYQVSFNVSPINDPPTIPCTAPVITLPPTFLIGQSPYHSFSILATDVDDSNLTFVLKSVPAKGILRDLKGLLLQAGSDASIAQFIFETNGTGGGYPYSNFTIFALDAENATSNECTFNFTFTCPPGLYNNIFKNGRGHICEPCPLGAVCSPDGSIAPRPQSGWWKGEDNNTFLECFPTSACTGTAENTCAEGYEGTRCASCQQNYYRLGEVCRACQLANYVPTIIAVSVMVGLVLLLALLQRFGVYKLSFASMNILINFLQTVWILRDMRLDWPQEILELLQHINFLAINIEIVAPECVIQAPLTFSQKLRIVFALPICLLCLTVLVVGIANCIKNIRGSRTALKRSSTRLNTVQRKRETVNGNAFGAIRTFHVSLSLLYVNIVAQSFALFDCTLEDDGKAWLDKEVSLVCYTDWWYQDLPYSVLAVVFYAFGIPLYFGVLSYFYYQKHHGQFWAKWRRFAGRLMEGFSDRHFKAEYQYFIVIQLLQKLAMVAVGTFFTRYTGLQIVLTIIILLSVLMTYMKYNPYLNPTLNTLEKLSVVCSIAVLAFGLPFKIDNFRISQYRSGLIAAIGLVVLGFTSAVLAAGLYDIRRNFRTFRLGKADIDPAFN